MAADSRTNAPKRLTRRVILARARTAAISLVAVAAVLAAVYAVFAFGYRGRMYPHLAIGAVQVGGLTPEEAKQAVAAQLTPFVDETKVLRVGDQDVTFAASSVHPDYDLDDSVRRAYAVGRSGAFLDDVVRQIGLAVSPVSVDPTMTFQADALDAFLDTVSASVDTPERDASFSIEDGDVAVTPAVNGQRFDRARLKEQLTRSLFALRYPASIVAPLAPSVAKIQADQVKLLAPSILRLAGSPLMLSYGEFHQEVTTDQLSSWLAVRPVGIGAGTDGTTALARLDIDRERIKQYLATLVDALTSEPLDAKLTIVNGKATVFQQSRDGTQLDLEQSAQAVITALEARRTAAVAPTGDVTLAVTVKKPTVSSDTLNTLGITELIGHGQTDFSGSPNNRVHNITVGTKYLNGWLVKPGDTFSTVTSLGPVDKSTGYLPELVIKENKTIPEYGGGLCQVSTTLFRAVLDAGLKVTERKNHSYRVSYYERGVGPGLDATVYLPKPDFQFLNDTPGWVLVQAEVTGTTLTFDLYGTKDGRTSEVQGPFTLSKTAPPPPVYETVSSLAPGQTKETEHAHEGAHTVATYIVRRDGQELFRQTFESFYKALPAHILRGADDAGAPAGETGEAHTDDSPSADEVPAA